MEQQTNRFAKMHMKSGKIDVAVFFLLSKVLMNLAKEGTNDPFDQMLGEVVAVMGEGYFIRKAILLSCGE